MPDPVEVVRDAPQKHLAPVDDTVKLPASVLAAAAKANSYYGAGDGNTPPAAVTPAPQPQPDQPAPQPDPAMAQPAPQPAPTPQPEPQPQPQPQPAPQPEPPQDANWEHRYNSMKGRYDQSQAQIAAMQEQMSQLGDELMRTQALMRGVAPQPQPQPEPQNLITEADVQNYGSEMIDVVKRAAQEAVAPKLSALESENAQLRQDVTRTKQAGVFQALDQHVPNWREINKLPAFKNWLRLRDIYSGAVRQTMLNAAHQAADAPRVVAFFKGFLSDEAVASGNAPVPQPSPAPQPPAPARQPAVQLETLTAPGRTRPATGDAHVTGDKPSFTRAQIQGFYTDVRRGAYAGREAEKNALEGQIFAAQREGRVR